MERLGKIPADRSVLPGRRVRDLGHLQVSDEGIELTRRLEREEVRTNPGRFRETARVESIDVESESAL